MLTEKRDVSFDRRVGLREAVEEDALYVTSEVAGPSVTNGQNLWQLTSCLLVVFYRLGRGQQKDAKWSNICPFLRAPTLRTSVRLTSPPLLFLQDHFCSYTYLTLGQQIAGKVLTTEKDPGSGNITHCLQEGHFYVL